MQPNLNTFTQKHRDNGGQIIGIKPTPWIRENLPDNINKLYQENSDATFYVKDNIEEYSMFPETIKIVEGDVILEKNNYSAFTNPKRARWSKGYFTYILGGLIDAMDSQGSRIRKQNSSDMVGHICMVM